MNTENILRHKRAHTTGLHLYEMYRIGKTRDRSGWVAAKGGREGRERELLLGTGFPSGVRKFLAGIIKWSWLLNTVTILNTTELHTSKCLKWWMLLHDFLKISIKDKLEKPQRYS